MPIVTSLVENLVPTQKTGFFDTEINTRAMKDFCFLVSKSQIGYSMNIKHVRLFNATNSFIADCTVIGATEKDKIVSVPKEVLHRDDNAFVVVVLYDGEKLEDVFLFPVVDLKSKHGLFSLYKDLKKQDCFGIKIKKKKKLADLKFGIVLQEYIK